MTDRRKTMFLQQEFRIQLIMNSTKYWLTGRLYVSFFINDVISGGVKGKWTRMVKTGPIETWRMFWAWTREGPSRQTAPVNTQILDLTTCWAEHVRKSFDAAHAFVCWCAAPFVPCMSTSKQHVRATLATDAWLPEPNFQCVVEKKWQVFLVWPLVFHFRLFELDAWTFWVAEVFGISGQKITLGHCWQSACLWGQPFLNKFGENSLFLVCLFVCFLSVQNNAKHLKRTK